jgi:hypothetical protein
MNSIVKDVKPKTTEQVRADARRRVIANAKKKVKRTSPTLSSPLPKAHPPKAPVVNPAAISSPLVPAFSEQTKRKVDLAVRALKIKGRSLNQRLLICHHHLRSDPVLSGIDPQELWKELSWQTNFKS